MSVPAAAPKLVCLDPDAQQVIQHSQPEMFFGFRKGIKNMKAAEGVKLQRPETLQEE